MKQVLLFAISLSVFSMSAAEVAAQDPYTCIDELTDEEVDVRLNWLDNSFQSGKRHARGWWYSWIALMGAITIGQVIWAVVADERIAKVSNTVGAVGAGLVTLQLSVFTHIAAVAPQRFRKHLQRTPEERKKKLRYGLSLLQKASKQQHQGRGVFAHLNGAIWSSVVGPVMQTRFNDWWTTLRMMGGGLVVTQLRIWSQPIAAAKAWARIRHFNCDVHASEARRARRERDAAKPEDAMLSYAGTGLRVSW